MWGRVCVLLPCTPGKYYSPEKRTAVCLRWEISSHCAALKGSPTEILHLLFDPVKHGKSSSSPADICAAPSDGHAHAFIFSANYLPASCCPNPVSPTFVSSLPLSAAYIVHMLYDYFSPPCIYLPGLIPNILFSLSLLPT